MSIEQLFRQDESWIAMDPVVGCLNNCKYCFLQSYDQTPKKGQIIAQPEETLNHLLSVDNFDDQVELMLGSETDFFMDEKNIEYLLKFLKTYKDKNFENVICLSTKGLVPEYFLQEIEDFPKDKIIFYLSYSGLSKKIEPRTDEKDLQQSFINIKNKGFKIVHYWRPFLPENSSAEKIHEILDFVVNYADCSVCSGLKLNEGILEKISPFWPELLEIDFNFATLSSIWPRQVKDYIFSLVKEKYPNYPLFCLNSCALSFIQEKPEFLGMQGNENCLINNCPKEQRKSCQEFIENRHIDLEEVKKLLISWGLNSDCYFSEEQNTIVLNSSVTHSQMVYLRRVFSIRFITEGSVVSQNEWGGTAINRKEMEI